MSPVERLLSVASARLETGAVLGLPVGERGDELGALLARRNGFVAFESALLVRGVGDGALGLRAWNAADGWRDRYAGMADGVFFFAEDVFGCQWGIRDVDDLVVTFDPETGDVTPFADTIAEWAAMVLEDFEYLTGWPAVRDWQAAHGPLPLGQRLVPVVPFVLGGDYEVGNLHAVDAYRGMRLRGGIAVQLTGVPDGAQVEITILD